MPSAPRKRHRAITHTKALLIRFTPADWERLESHARVLGLPLGSWLRSLGLREVDREERRT